MGTLSEHQFQLIFDYCIGIIESEKISEVELLIESSQEASDIYHKINNAVAPLQSLQEQQCPDDLVERTVLRLNNTARSSQLQLENMLAAEQRRYSNNGEGFWLSISKRLAMAAVFIIVGSFLITTFNVTTNYARQKSQCQAQLFNIFQGFMNYQNDHDGQTPAVAIESGQPWWKVGYEGNENHSNTRKAWLMVKGGYVDAAKFVCPGHQGSQTKPIPSDYISRMNDFPSKRYISYSIQVKCPNKSPYFIRRRAVISDMNPLFENLPKQFSDRIRIHVNDKLMRMNSRNHMRRGQNVLFCDGSVTFVRKRQVDISNDDIFTIRDYQVYEGVEMPVCELDNFLAP
jgi:prepilin-type processing-associated H-X9-DG protein